MFDHRIDKVFVLAEVADIGLNRDGVTAVRANQFHSFSGGGGVGTVVDRKLPAPFGQCQRHPLSDPPPRAGDDGDTLIRYLPVIHLPPRLSR